MRKTTTNEASQLSVGEAGSGASFSKKKVAAAASESTTPASTAATASSLVPSASSAAESALFDVDVERAKRGVWLVKVPKQVSREWEKHPGAQIGKLVVDGGGEVHFVGSTPAATTTAVDTSAGAKGTPAARQPQPPAPAAENSKNSENAAAEAEMTMAMLNQPHSFLMNNPTEAMVIMSVAEAGGGESGSGKKPAAPAKTRLRMEGRVVKRCEIRPIATADYLRMKSHYMENQLPKHSSLQVESRVVRQAALTHNPKERQAMLRAKKEKGFRAVAVDKERVRELVFHAFEQHQYYKFADLQRVVGQPAGILREVLDEIGHYCTEHPHRSLWELKPEYTHYVQPSKASSS